MKTHMMANDCAELFQDELDYMREENARVLELASNLSNELESERAAKRNSDEYVLKLVEALDKVTTEKDALRAQLEARWAVCKR